MLFYIANLYTACYCNADLGEHEVSQQNIAL